jgi:hypothetical protein
MFENRHLNRRNLMAYGLGLLAIKLPLVKISADQSSSAVVDLAIDFPEGYNMENYELDVPSWTDNEKIRKYIRSFVSSGQLVEYKKVGRERGVSYRFVFKTHEDLKSFVVGVRNQRLVDFERRSSRGLTTKMIVSGAEIKC